MRIALRRRQTFLGLVTLTLLVSGTVQADTITDWNTVSIEALMQAQLVSTRAARTLAMVHGAMYDAVNAIDRTHQVFYVNAPLTPGASPVAAAAAAAQRVLLALFPDQADRFDSALASSLATVADGSAKVDGLLLGELVGQATVQWRSMDHSMDMTSYTPGSDPGQWRPTPPDYLPAMMPHWGAMAPFALDPRSLRVPPPPALTSAQYAAELSEVAELGAKMSSVRTEEQGTIAMFWADMPGTATTVGRWNYVAQTAAASYGNSLEQNARLFALLNTALADAGIVAWESKFYYNFWRPVTAIAEADTDGNPATEPDPSWEPLLKTPAFPEYPSAHSTFSVAAARVLAMFFGSDQFEFQIPSFQNPAMGRAYSTFMAAAEEAGMSRIYAGIHFPSGNSQGLAAGARVAQEIWDQFYQPLHDSAEFRLSEFTLDAGDRFLLTARLTNAQPTAQDVEEFIALDVLGAYWFWPAWTATPAGSSISLLPGQVLDQTILDFTWPAGAGTADGIRFWIALLRDGTELFGDYDLKEFSFR